MSMSEGKETLNNRESIGQERKELGIGNVRKRVERGGKGKSGKELGKNDGKKTDIEKRRKWWTREKRI